MKKLKDQEVFYDVDSNDDVFCYILLERHHPVLKRTIQYRVDFDIDDLELIKSNRWFIHDWGYAFFPLQEGGVTIKTIYMHRLVAERLLDEGESLNEVDHTDWNKLNNRRSNLKSTDRRGNMSNLPPQSPFGRHYVQTIHSNHYQAYAPNENEEEPAILLGEFATREKAIEAQKQYIFDFNCAEIENKLRKGHSYNRVS